MKTINKALNIMELFMNNKTELTFREIAAASGLKKATAHRIISTLTKRGFLKQRRKRGAYSLGIRLLDLAGTSLKGPEMGNTAIPHIMVELSKLVNESVYFTVWYGSDILLSRAFENRESADIVPADWKNLPLHLSCVGKIILANMSEEDLNKYFHSGHLSRLTSKKIEDIAGIKKQLAAVKREGVAFEEEEGNPGVCGIAAGVKNNEGETIGAAFIMGHSARLTHDVLKKIVPSIQRCALKISRELGYQP
jgi:IclR family transcriptional regulator, KDG regulon repressor